MRNILKDWFVEANIRGRDNAVLCETPSGTHPVRLKSPQSFLKIRGDGNRVILRRSADSRKSAGRLPPGLALTIRGNGNHVVLEDVRFVKSALSLTGDGCRFEIGATEDPIREVSIWIADGGSVIIGRNFGPQERLKIVVDNDAETKHKLVIGDDVLTAVDTVIRTSDGHSLVDSATGMPMNEPQDVIIGNRVWIGTRCTILKGSVIADGCVVGANSLVKGKFPEPGLLLVGAPARVLRRGVRWDALPYGALHEKRLREGKTESHA